MMKAMDWRQRERIELFAQPEWILKELITVLGRASLVKMLDAWAKMSPVSGTWWSKTEYLREEAGVTVANRAGSGPLARCLETTLHCSKRDGGGGLAFGILQKELNRKVKSPLNYALLCAKKAVLDYSWPFILEEAEEHGLEHLLITPFNEEYTGPKLFDHAMSLVGERYRHILIPSRYAHFPIKGAMLHIEPIDLVVAEAAKNPAVIRNLTPREFEFFIARIFQGHGFEVEVTSPTRDGGIDIFCFSHKMGIPLKLAVEVKRYARKPITVELVRAFVGAGEAVGANKLVYVTTSRYTKDAVEYAKGPMIAHRLELKALSDIVKWAEVSWEFAR